MIYLCCHCGVKLNNPVKYGFTTCNNCNKILDSSDKNKVLSACWAARRSNVDDVESVKQMYELTDKQAAFVQEYVVEKSFTHDEVLKILDKIL